MKDTSRINRQSVGWAGIVLALGLAGWLDRWRSTHGSMPFVTGIGLLRPETGIVLIGQYGARLLVALALLGLLCVGLLGCAAVHHYIIQLLDNRRGVLLTISLPRRNPRDSFIARELFNAWYGIRSSGPLAWFRSQPRLALEIEATRRMVRFQLWTVHRWAEYVADQMRAKYPECRVDAIERPPMRKMPHVVQALRLKRPAEYPIQTQKNYDASDPMAGLLGTMSSLELGEDLILQIVCRPLASQHAQRTLRRIIARRRTGLREDPRERRLAESRTKDRSEFEEYQLKAMEAKAGENGYQVAVRIGGWASTGHRARLLRDRLVAALAEVSVGSLNGFVPARLPAAWVRRMFQHRLLPWRSRCSLGISELPSLWHFPHENVRLPYLVQQPAKAIRAPQPVAELPGEQAVWLGHENAVDAGQRVGVLTEDRFRHLYIVGKTGVGKTTLLTQLILQDAIAGRGLIVIDPKGDLVDEVLHHVPDSVASRTLLLDPARLHRPAALNVLEADLDDPLEVSLTVDALVNTFVRLYGSDAIGPRSQQLLRQGALACMAADLPLLRLPHLLLDDATRRSVLHRLPPGPTRMFWQDVYSGWRPALRQEYIAPLLNKLDRFAGDAILRTLLGQARSSIDLARCMRECVVLLINLSPVRLGDENSRLLGQLFLTRIWLTRRREASAAFPPTFLYCDEFQQVVSPVFEEMLSLGRSHGLALILAHQYVEQLDDLEPRVRHAVFGNVGNILAFRVSPASAQVLSARFQGRFDVDDLQLLAPYELAAQLVVKGQEVAPFSARTLPLGPRSTQHLRRVRVLSDRRLGRPHSVARRELSRTSPAAPGRPSWT